METHIFKLLSGVECEIKRFKTLHQALLFPLSTEGVNMAKNINKVLADIIVRLGSDEDITKEKCAQLLSADRQFILVMCGKITQQYTAKMLSLFRENGEIEEKEEPFQDGKLSIPLRFEYTFKIDEEREDKVLIDDYFFVDMKPYKSQFEDYEEVKKNLEFDCALPNGKKVRMKLVTGQTEASYQNLKKGEFNTNTFIRMFTPRWVEKREIGQGVKKEEKEVVTSAVNVDELEVFESAFLRKAIQENNGQFNPFITIRHPEIESIEQQLNIIQIPEFFFPSIEDSF